MPKNDTLTAERCGEVPDTNCATVQPFDNPSTVGERELRREVAGAQRTIRYGSAFLTLHNGQVGEIQRMERTQGNRK